MRHELRITMADSGRSEAAVGRYLRVTTPAITRRYTDRRLRQEDAEAHADWLVPQSAPQSRKAGGRK